MRTSQLGRVLLLLGTSALVACSSGRDDGKPNTPKSAQVTIDDLCGAGNATNEADDPNAPCAIRTENNVPDLALGDAPRAATDADADEESTPAGNVDVGTQSLRPLDRPGGQVASCNGRSGPGFTTCGAQGNDSCCHANTVPAGRAGTVSVGAAFDMGVYEVTSGRFQAFVATFNGNLRGAAQAGQIPGLPANVAAALPASRAQVDNELGVGCKFRSDVADFGARTWPLPDIPQTVASFITDNNARAADIRADASAERLSAKPINCVSHQMARAFCAWDGGRLPTNAEWAYVALGAGQGAVRTYPWGAGRTKIRLVTDLTGTNSDQFTYPEDFPFFGNGFNAYHIAPPGRKPAGASAFGIQDMGGNLLEWMADVTGPNAGIVRGGSWEGHRDENDFAYVNYPLDRTYGSVGFRCAYGSSQPPPPPPPPPPPVEVRQQPIHRSYNGQIGDHLQGLTQNEGAPAWRYEGISFSTLNVQVDGTVPLFRCRLNGTSNHFVSNAANCEGQTVEGALGFVYAAQAAGTVGVFRCVNGNGRDHLTTATPQECTNAGFRIEGRQGFAFPPAAPPPPPPPPPPAACGQLGVNGVLSVNQSVSSCDRRFSLVMQPDGNLVLYKVGVKALWNSGTFNTPSNRAVMQGDGNFVVYDTANRARFNTRTFNNPGATLAIQNDGNLVVYSTTGRALWNSGTFGN